jgi:DNA-binding SARP family transcriptional activator
MARTRFGVLGSLETRTDAGPLTVAGPRRRSLLALLVVNANRVITVNRAIDGLWGDQAPASARAQVQALIHALRQHLSATAETSIETRPEGYTLVIDPEDIDLFVFERRAAAAREAVAGGRLEEAAGCYQRALDLWRGPALDGIDAPFVSVEAVRLDEERLLVTVERAEADLALGRPAEVVAKLASLVAAHPFREQLQAALMLALYRCGRRAEALEAYRGVRRAMVEELGLDPGRRLQELEQAMLRDDPSLALDPAPAPPPAVPGGPRGVRL